MGAGCTRCIAIRSPTEAEFHASVREEIHHLRVGIKLQEKRRASQKISPPLDTFEETVVVLDDIVRAESTAESTASSRDGSNELVSGTEKFGSARERSQNGNGDKCTKQVEAPMGTSLGHTAGACLPTASRLAGQPAQEGLDPGAIGKECAISKGTTNSMVSNQHHRVQVRTVKTLKELPPRQQLKSAPPAQQSPTTSVRVPCATFGSDKPSALWQRRYGVRVVHPSFLKVPYVPKDA